MAGYRGAHWSPGPWTVALRPLTVVLAGSSTGSRASTRGLKPIHEWIGGFERFWSQSFDRLNEYVQELQREEETNGVAHSSPTDGDREIVVARTIEGPRRLVFQEFTDGMYLAEWWGPNFRDARPRSGGFAELDRMARAREEE